MPDVSFKDICIDVTDAPHVPERVAEFWSTALNQTIEQSDGEYALVPPAGGPSSRRVWLCEVPEPCEVKTRVHLDLRLPNGDPAPLVAAGARVVREPTDADQWHVIEAPDGIALCIMNTGPEYDDFIGPFELNVDSTNPRAIAQWWAERTGGVVKSREGANYVWIEGADGFPFHFWVFGEVPEPKTVKNRVHWDVVLRDATVSDLVAAGATVLREADDDIYWTVMADPEGNEFCAFVPND